MNYAELFEDAAKTLVDPNDNFFELKQTLERIHRAYADITGIKAYTTEGDTDTRLAYGKAVSPIVAAGCLLDLLRTKRFIQGVYKGICQMQKRFNGDRLRILYAGSGPYGTLITPLCHLFDASVFSCTAIDIHTESVVALHKVIHTLGVEKYFDGILKCDAFNWQAMDNERPHIIISEVLQMGLRNEPQVALTHHLLPQLKKGGMFIPKEIRLDLFHSKKIEVDMSDTTLARREKAFLGNVLTLNEEYVNRQHQLIKTEPLIFAPIKIPIPQRRTADDTLELQTTLEIADDVLLTQNQSSLTVPITLTSFRNLSDSTVFELEYKISNTSGIKWRALP